MCYPYTLSMMLPNKTFECACLFSRRKRDKRNVAILILCCQFNQLRVIMLAIYQNFFYYSFNHFFTLSLLYLISQHFIPNKTAQKHYVCSLSDYYPVIGHALQALNPLSLQTNKLISWKTNFGRVAVLWYSSKFRKKSSEIKDNLVQ